MLIEINSFLVFAVKKFNIVSGMNFFYIECCGRVTWDDFEFKYLLAVVNLIKIFLVPLPSFSSWLTTVSVKISWKV